MFVHRANFVREGLVLFLVPQASLHAVVLASTYSATTITVERVTLPVVQVLCV